MGKLMNNIEELLKSYFGGKLKSGKREADWIPTNPRRLSKKIIDLVYEIKVIESKYKTKDGLVKYFAVVTFIGSSSYVTYDIDLKVKCQEGDLIDPKSVIVADLVHKNTGTILSNRLFGKVIKD